MDLASILREVLDFWHNPPATELSEDALLDCANRRLTEHNIDLDLTPDACFFTNKSSVFTFADSDARERDLSTIIDDASRISRVESRDRTSTSEDDWIEETITRYDNWNDVMERGDGNFVSFYGLQPDRTMVINRDVSALEFRIVYKVLRDRIESAAQQLELPDIYRPVFVYDIALEVGEMIDNRSPEFVSLKRDKMQYLEARYKNATDRLEKWRRSQKGTSIATRRPFNDRSGRVSNFGGRGFNGRP